MNEKTNELTLVTPVFNRRDSLQRSFESLKNALSENMTWIVSDNKSTDGSIDWLKGNQGIFGFTLILQEEHSSALMHFKKAISAADTKFVILCACDDLWSENYFSDLLQTALATNADGVIGNVLTGTIDEYEKNHEGLESKQSKLSQRIYYLTGTQVNHVYGLYRKELVLEALEEIAIAKPTLGLDRIWLYKLLRHAKIEISNDCSEFHYKLTFEPALEFSSATLANVQPGNRSSEMLHLAKLMVREELFWARDPVVFRVARVIRVLPRWTVELMDACMPTQIRVILHRIKHMAKNV